MIEDQVLIQSLKFRNTSSANHIKWSNMQANLYIGIYDFVTI